MDCPLQDKSKVRSLAGDMVTVKGPFKLSIEICNLLLVHNFFYFDGMDQCLLGYDLVKAAALVIDSESSCVWSNHTIRQRLYPELSPLTDVPHDMFSVTKTSTNTAADTQILPFSSSAVVSGNSVIAELDMLHSSCAHTNTSTDSHVVSAKRTSHVMTDKSTEITNEEAFIVLATPMPVSQTDVPNMSDLDNGQLDSATKSMLSSSLPVTESDFVVPFYLGNSVSSLVNPVVDHTYADLRPVQITMPDTDNTLTKKVSSETLTLPEHVNVLFLQTVADKELGSETEKGLKQLLWDHRDTFAKSKTDIGFCDLVKHDIDTGDARPIKQSPRRPPLNSGSAEDNIITEMLAAGVIQPSDSAWASPVCLVKKRDNTFRFFIDYRKLNAVSHKDAFLLPDIRQVLDSLRGTQYMITLDLQSGYWQLGTTDRARERSAFC